MFPDPFAPAGCTETVGLLRAMILGTPEDGCIEISVTPLSLMIGLAVLGGLVLAMQVLLGRMMHGPDAPGPSRTDHDPDRSQREIANRARADRLHIAPPAARSSRDA